MQSQACKTSTSLATLCLLKLTAWWLRACLVCKFSFLKKLLSFRSSFDNIYLSWKLDAGLIPKLLSYVASEGSAFATRVIFKTLMEFMQQAALRMNCLWETRQLKMHPQFAAAVSPGVPSAFHSNYKAAVAFLTALEERCKTPAAVTALRNCPAHESFMRRWKLSIYFSTRFQVILPPHFFNVHLSSTFHIDAYWIKASHLLQLQLILGKDLAGRKISEASTCLTQSLQTLRMPTFVFG